MSGSSDPNKAESHSRSRSRTRTGSNSRGLDPEAVLLRAPSARDRAGRVPGHTLITAPIVTGDAFHALGPAVFPQRALYGTVISQHANGFPEEPRVPKVYINSNTPFSAVVCGVQGSGKSHSTSVLLESCLIQDERLGTLPAPLSGLVFHFGSAAGGGMEQPCEAAYLSALDSQLGGSATAPRVTVLAMPASVPALAKVYAGLPLVELKPLRFAPQDITADRLLAMMKVEEGGKMPLYMEYIMNVLRGMEGNFNYDEFRKQLKAQEFNPGQKAMLNMRLALLDSCLEGGNASNRVPNYFKKGHLTIIDLSSPFMDSSSACGLFDIILGLFVGTKTDSTGKIVVLDEAHKYLTDDGSSQRLTESLLTVIREQRHLATRVVISTQEPTVVPAKFLDLCSFVIAHRFSSPEWLRHLSKHVSAAVSSQDDLYDQVSSLETGEALLFAPAGLGLRSALFADFALADGPAHSAKPSPVARFGRGHLLVSSRLRITQDGGQSVLAVQDASTPVEGRQPWQFAEEPRVDAAPWPTPPAVEGSLTERPLTPESLGRSGELNNSHGEDLRRPDGLNPALDPRTAFHGSVPEFSLPPRARPAHETTASHSPVLSSTKWEADISQAPLAPLDTIGKASSASDSPSETSEESSADSLEFADSSLSLAEAFKPLITLLEQKRKEGRTRVPWPTVAFELVHSVSPPAISSGKREFLEPYLQAAADAGLIVFQPLSATSGGSVELSASYQDLLKAPTVASTSVTQQEHKTSPSGSVTMSPTDDLAQLHSTDAATTSGATASAGVVPSTDLSIHQLHLHARHAHEAGNSPAPSSTETKVIDSHAPLAPLDTTGKDESAYDSQSKTSENSSADSSEPADASSSLAGAFKPLIALLEQKRKEGRTLVPWPMVAFDLVHSVYPPAIRSGKREFLEPYLEAAVDAGLISFQPLSSTSGGWVALSVSYQDFLKAPPVQSQQERKTPPTVSVPVPVADTPTQVTPTAGATTAGATDIAGVAPPTEISQQDAFQHIVSVLKTGQQKMTRRRIADSCTLRTGLSIAEGLASCLRNMKLARIVDEDAAGVWLIASPEMLRTLDMSWVPQSSAVPAAATEAGSSTAAINSTPSAHMSSVSAGGPSVASNEKLSFVNGVQDLTSFLNNMHCAGNSKVSLSVIAQWLVAHPVLSKPDALARCLQGMKTAKIVDEDDTGVWLTSASATRPVSGSHGAPAGGPASAASREATAAPSSAPPPSVNAPPTPPNIYFGVPSTSSNSGRNEPLHAAATPTTSIPTAATNTTAPPTAASHTPPTQTAPLRLVGDYSYLVSLLKSLHRAGHAKVTIDSLARSCPFHPALSKRAELARCLGSMKAARVIDEDRYGIWLTKSGEAPGPSNASSGIPPSRGPVAGPSVLPGLFASSSPDAGTRASDTASSAPVGPLSDPHPPAVATPVVPMRFAPLVDLLRQQRGRGISRVMWSELGAPLKKTVPELAGSKIKAYLTAAVEAGIIDLQNASVSQNGWVELRGSYVFAL